MSDRLPGSSYDNPIWHRGYRIWSCTDAHDRHVFAWAHDEADMDDDTDRRHGEASSQAQAKADIDDLVDYQEFNAEQRRKAPAHQARYG